MDLTPAQEIKLQTLVETFETVVRLAEPKQDWLVDAAKEILLYSFSFPVGDRVPLWQHVQEHYSVEQATKLMGKLIPYITGPYGTLKTEFEDETGLPIRVRNYLNTQVPDYLNQIVCETETGELVPHSKVKVYFSRIAD